MTKNLNTIVKWVHDSYHGQYKTIGQASEEVGRSSRTLKRWKAAGKVEAPSHFVDIGKNKKVNLYSDSDLKELHQYAEVVRPGRPRTIPCGE